MIPRKYSMAFSGGRAEFLKKAVRQVQNLPGDFVECGVYKGGCCMLMATELLKLNQERMIWMYDTFKGMPQPGPEDVKFNGEKGTDKWHKDWCKAPMRVVKINMRTTGYPYYKCIRGDVLETIPEQVPEQIAILRLDTDFYASTKHELEHLYPLLVKGGVLIVDDYSSWRGSRQACDEYFPDQELQKIGTSNASYLIKDE